MEPKEGENRRDCWSVAFGNSYNSEERVVAAGYDNGDVKMFDLKAMSVRWESNLKNGVCGLEFDRSDIPMNKLVASTLESKFYLFDLRTQHPKKGFAYLVEKVCCLIFKFKFSKSRLAELKTVRLTANFRLTSRQYG